MIDDAKLLAALAVPNPEALGVDPVEYTIMLEDLVHWLAIPYGDNDPVFAFTNVVTGEELTHNIALARTWYRVVRGTGLPTESLGGPLDGENGPGGTLPPGPPIEGLSLTREEETVQ